MYEMEVIGLYSKAVESSSCYHTVFEFPFAGPLFLLEPNPIASRFDMDSFNSKVGIQTHEPIY